MASMASWHILICSSSNYIYNRNRLHTWNMVIRERTSKIKYMKLHIYLRIDSDSTLCMVVNICIIIYTRYTCNIEKINDYFRVRRACFSVGLCDENLVFNHTICISTYATNTHVCDIGYKIRLFVRDFPALAAPKN